LKITKCASVCKPKPHISPRGAKITKKKHKEKRQKNQEKRPANWATGWKTKIKTQTVSV